MKQKHTSADWKINAKSNIYFTFYSLLFPSVIHFQLPSASFNRSINQPTMTTMTKSSRQQRGAQRVQAVSTNLRPAEQGPTSTEKDHPFDVGKWSILSLFGLERGIERFSSFMGLLFPFKIFVKYGLILSIRHDCRMRG